MKYEWNEEFLKMQADYEYTNIQTVFRQLNIDKNMSYSILDIGCSNGYNTLLVFKDFINSHIIGIDVDNIKIQDAQKRYSNNQFSFECINFLDCEIEGLKEKWGSFDIIYCSYVIQYVKEPRYFISMCHKLLKNNGFIVIKSSDDSGKIAYPHSEILNEIINFYSKYIVPESDRFLAKKCYSLLRLENFKNITYNYFIKDTVNKTLTEKIALYNEDFLFRQFGLDLHNDGNPFVKRYSHLLRLLYELFQRDDFYYSSIAYIITAQK